MYKTDKSKPIILGTELNNDDHHSNTSCSDNEYPTDDSDTEKETRKRNEEVKGNFVFINTKKKKNNKLKPESYIEE